ncbi:hypothetical protein R1sor_019040 [Riccia sorocarpa]|uniref:Uncharacterized protein n=1 Tax=Riccia sorocarpa TaxID=122646 RepID=A0ABD3IBE0_9MARC
MSKSIFVLSLNNISLNNQYLTPPLRHGPPQMDGVTLHSRSAPQYAEPRVEPLADHEPLDLQAEPLVAQSLAQPLARAGHPSLNPVAAPPMMLVLKSGVYVHGGQPGRQERHRTHRTGAGEVRTTPSTVGGGRPPTYRGGSSGAWSSEGGRPRVSSGAASGGSGAASGGSGQTSIPVSVPASRPSTFAPATTERGSGPSGEGPSRPTLGPLDVSQMFETGADVAAFTRTQMQEWVERVLERGLEQFAAQYGLGRGTSPAPSGGGASTDRGDDTRRRRSRSSHEDDLERRDRRRSRRSSPDVERERRPQSVPLVSLQLDTYGHPEGDSMRVLEGMVREVCRLYLTDDTTWAEVPENQRLAIATRLAAKYGPVSVQHQNAERRIEIRREKNVMKTNPFGHMGFAGYRARFNAFVRAHGIKGVFEFMEKGRDIPEIEVGGPSNADAGEDGADDDDFAAAADAGAGAVAVAGTRDDVDDDDVLTDFSEGAELEEDEHGLTPSPEQDADDGGDDEDDTDTSLDWYQIRPSLCEHAQPTGSAAQRLARLVVGAP